MNWWGPRGALVWVVVAGCGGSDRGEPSEVVTDVHDVDGGDTPEADAAEDSEDGRDGESGDGEDDGDDEEVEVHSGHPCPEWAVAPSGTRLWGPDEVAPLGLRLPTPDGVEVVVTQGNDGDYTHVGDQRFAWDFGVPYGTTVHAAATGLVVWVEDGRIGAGPGPEWRELANFVVLDHGGGLFTSYVHLGIGSARVSAGDVVEVGEVLAETGESGQLTGPHIHFQVENVWSESVPAVFARGGRCNWVPRIGEVVVATAVELGLAWALSEMPGEAFAEDGVVEVVGLPARLLSRTELYEVAGRVPARAATEVYFLALPPEGGAAVFAQRFAVAPNRKFEGVLDLSDLGPGQYGVALVAGTGQAVRVPRSVRAAVIE